MDLSNCTEKFIVLNDHRFTRDEKTGYYRCDKLRKRLHQYVWENERGKVPKGFHVHHIDHDKRNNDISNLIAIPGKNHLSDHEQERLKDEDFRNFRIKTMNEKARPKAIEWHKSKEGREWHSKQSKEIAKTRKLAKFTCDHCSNGFETWNTSRNRFCSNKCKSAWRRKQGLDDEQRNCEYCNEEYVVNKYRKTRFCSKACSNRAIPRLSQSRKK